MRKLAFLTAALVGLTLPSFAGVVYSGSDTACFYGALGTSCTPTAAASTIGVSSLLTYTPGSFTNAPAGPVALGTFTVDHPFFSVASGTFDMDVTFTAPPGAGSQTFDATIAGLVFIGSGGASITFDNPTTQMFTYSGGGFELSLPTAPILIGVGNSQTLFGTIVAATPEPSLFLLLGLGVGLMVLVSKTRSRVDAR